MSKKGESMDSPDNEKMKNPCEEMNRLAQKTLLLKKWGFQESYRSNKDERLIYDSAWCRVKLVWSGWEVYTGNTMSMYYGRLHAVNDLSHMIWNGEACHCWHRVELVLHFLDKRLPEYAAQNIYTHSLIGKYYEDEFQKKYYRRQPEWLVHMHATIWENYAPRLFEVFDLRHPDLWEQYQQFVKQVYDIKSRNPAINPPLDKIC
jgi:hypothetical protein